LPNSTRSGLDVERNDPARFIVRAGSDGQHLALDRLFLGRIGDDDAARSFLLGLDAPEQDAVVQRLKRAMVRPPFGLVA
jgi:hypothetical protein